MADSTPPLAFPIRGPLEREALPALCERFSTALRDHRPTLVVCEVRDVDADAVTVDALARMQLAAHRYGCRVQLRGCDAELRALVAFMGLRDVLAT